MRFIRKRRNRTGFTLIELVVASVALVVVAFAVYMTLSGGLKIWQRINLKSSEEDVDIFFEKFTSDLRNVIICKGTVFTGEGDVFELPALVTSQKLGSRSAGRVRYSYDRERKVIRRHFADFSDIYSGSPGTAQELISGIKSMRFQYYVYEPGVKEYLWRDEWADKALPLAIRAELETEHNDKRVRFTRTAEIPVAN
ncbi:MAG: type II secretion system protein GspJ [Candidatus Omnitrophota bacterium]